MATFNSMSYAAIVKLLNSSGLVAGSLYYATDTQQLFLACTNSDAGVGIAQVGLIMTGGIQLGFSGNAATIDSVPVSGTPNVGDVLQFNGTAWVPAPAPSSGNVVVNVSGAYTTEATDDILFVNLSVPAEITLTTDGIVSGKVYRVTVFTTSAEVLVVAEGGAPIQGQTDQVQLLAGDSVDFGWDGEGFVIQ